MLSSLNKTPTANSTIKILKKSVSNQTIYKVATTELGNSDTPNKIKNNSNEISRNSITTTFSDLVPKKFVIGNAFLTSSW